MSPGVSRRLLSSVRMRRSGSGQSKWQSLRPRAWRVPGGHTTPHLGCAIVHGHCSCSGEVWQAADPGALLSHHGQLTSSPSITYRLQEAERKRRADLAAEQEAARQKAEVARAEQERLAKERQVSVIADNVHKLAKSFIAAQPTAARIAVPTGPERA